MGHSLVLLSTMLVKGVKLQNLKCAVSIPCVNEMLIGIIVYYSETCLDWTPTGPSFVHNIFIIFSMISVLQIDQSFSLMLIILKTLPCQKGQQQPFFVKQSATHPHSRTSGSLMESTYLEKVAVARRVVLVGLPVLFLACERRRTFGCRLSSGNDFRNVASFVFSSANQIMR